ASADSALLQGQNGAFYRNASNINAGTLNNAYLDSSVSLLGQTIGVNELEDDAVTTLKIVDGNVTNNKLANASLTITAGDGLINGGSVSLGSAVTLNIGAGNGISVTADDISIAVRSGGGLSVDG